MARLSPFQVRSRPAVPLHRWAFILWLLVISTSSQAAPPVSYRNEVIPILSRAGCSMGACHGNGQGKGGFKLSLRNEEPKADHRILTREFLGRRINLVHPTESLLLRKATSQLAHEGGQRFTPSSTEYQLIHDWIQQGALDDHDQAPKLVKLEVTPSQRVLPEPESQTRLQAFATFNDGSRRDVTGLSWFQTDNLVVRVEPSGWVYREGWGESVVLVRYLHLQVPVRIAFIRNRPVSSFTTPPAQNFIDRSIDQRLRDLRIEASPLCTDQEFVRRVFLDLTGRVPSAEEARRFVSDPSPLKRDHLVEHVLALPDFADFWALKWGDLLRNEEKSLDPRGIRIFHQWIKSAFLTNMPMDHFARAVVTAQGSTYDVPPANFYRALRDPLGRAESVAQVFLGTRLQCAKCHNHPFDQWTQTDYYDWADVFSQIQYRVLENRPLDGLDKHEFNGEQVVWRELERHLNNAKTGRPARARFLGESSPATEGERLEELAQWLTAPSNPWFSKVQVNRVWAQFFGRGIVDAVDDFRATNPGSNPELLQALAEDFSRHQFDLRHLIRTITTSRTYQASSTPVEANQDDDSQFSHPQIRRLTAEQLLDSMAQVLGASHRFRGQPSGLRAIQLPGGQRNPRGGQSSADRFLAVFGKPERLLTCDCERSESTTMAQALQLVSGPTLNEMVAQQNNRLGGWLKQERNPGQWIEDLYWHALSRSPSDQERQMSLRLFEQSKPADSSQDRTVLEDLAWALLNSKEFVFRK